MDLNDPPLLGNIRNIYQRFFAELYEEPRDPRQATRAAEEAKAREAAARQAEEEEARRVAQKQKAVTPAGKARAKPPEVPKRQPTEEPPPPPPTAPEPAVAIPEPPCPFQAQIAALKESLGLRLQRNTEAAEELRRRRAELLAQPGDLPLNPEALLDHASRLVDGCINIARLIQEQDDRFSDTYKVPSALTPPADFDFAATQTGSAADRTAFSPHHKSSAPDSPGLQWATKAKKKAVARDESAMLLAERATMARMNAVANHLLNPRFVPPGGQVEVQAQLRMVSEATTLQQLRCVPPLSGNQLRLTQLEAVCGADGPQLLSAEPPVLLFTAYRPGGVYEQVIKVRNVSGLSRRCRVMPPRTPFFSVSLERSHCGRSLELQRNSKLIRSQTPEESEPNASGLIAPGMAVSYVVRFSPDALCGYVDRLLVCCEWSSFEVPLQARRPPPALSLPPELQCGPCALHGETTLEIRVVNSGGEAAFSFSDEAERAQMDTAPEQPLVVGPFEIVPRRFGLRTGESQLVRCTFRPMAEALYEAEVFLMCDNGDVMSRPLKGTGVAPLLLLRAINGAPLDAASPFHSNHTLLSFGDVNIGAHQAKTISYLNPTSIEVPFHWRAVPAETEEQAADGAPQAPVPFTVAPDCGAFRPDEERSFTVQFHPSATRDYKASLLLVLESPGPWDAAPLPPDVLPLQASMDSTGFFASGRFSRGPDVPKAVSVVEVIGVGSPLDIALLPAVLGDLSTPYVAGLGLASQRSLRLVNSSSHSAWFCFDPTAEERRLIAAGDEAALQALARPKAPQAASAHAEALEQARGARLVFTPRVGCALPGTTVTVALQHAFPRAGVVDCRVSCAVQWLPEPLTFRLLATVEGAGLRLEPEVLDFGILNGLRENTATVTVHNDAEVPLAFTLQYRADYERETAWKEERAAHEARRLAARQRAAMSGGLLTVDPELDRDLPAFRPLYRFTPAAHRLAPHQRMAVTVTYTPQEVRPVDDQIEVHVAGSRTQLLPVRGDVQVINACISPPILELEDAFLEVPITRTVVLQNLSGIDTAFQWAVIEDPSVAETSFDVPNGVLRGTERLAVTVTITVHRSGPLHLLIPCCLAGMAQPIACAAVCPSVTGVRLSFTVGPAEPARPTLECEDGRSGTDFAHHLVQNLVAAAVGDAPAAWLPVVDYGRVALGAAPGARFITVRNHSGSYVGLRCEVGRYGVADDYSTLMAAASEDPKNQAGTILGDAHEKTQTFTSKGGASVLERRRQATALQRFTEAAVEQAGSAGVAFLFERPPGAEYSIAPGGILTFPLWCAANLPGVYEDHLVILGNAGKGLPEARLPIRVEVTGVPLRLAKVTTGVTPVEEGGGAAVRFPPVTVGSAAQQAKEVRIENVCPQPMELSWCPCNGGNSELFTIQPAIATIAPNTVAVFTVQFRGQPGTPAAQYAARWVGTVPCGAPFSLEAVATVLAPGLVADPRAMKFKDCPVNAKPVSRTIRLTNPHPKPLRFTLALSGHEGTAIQLTRLVKVPDCADPDLADVRSDLPLGSRLELFSREAVDVTCMFSPGLCTQFVEREALDGVKVRCVAAEVLLDFDGTQQAVPIEAAVQYPVLVLDADSLTFTPARNDAAWPKTVRLVNHTAVPAPYELYHVPNMKPVSTQASLPPAETPGERLADAMDQTVPVDEPDAFHITPMRGVVPGKRDNRAGEQELSVQFTPLASATYCCSFRVDVTNGTGCDLVLRGAQPLREHADIMARQLVPTASYMRTAGPKG
eukprot:EG_transcript_172